MEVPREGDRIAGKYLVEKVIGEGGMGVVVAARHEALDQRVAIKFLLPHVISDPLVVERFAREARAAARIQSAHVARVIDVGTLDDGSPYMVMEYLEGEDVETYLERKGPLEIAEAVGIIIEACEAIAEAHMASIVHRDLKPANLFLARTPGRRVVKVLDFGISKFSKDTKGPKTQTGGLLGTPYYMSPEQLTDTKNVDGRSDIWTLGIILYQLLSGVVPFHGETLPEVVGQILKNVPGKLRDARPDVPEALDQVILKCMSTDPAMRFADVGELVNALAPFAPGARAHVEAVTRALTGASGPPSTSSIGGAATLATGSVPPPTGSALELDLVRRPDRPVSAGTLGAVARLEEPKRPRSPLPYVVMALSAATAIGVVAFVLGKGHGGSGTVTVEPTVSATVSVAPPPPSASSGVAALPPSAVPAAIPSAIPSATSPTATSTLVTTHPTGHPTASATAKPSASVAATTPPTATATATATATTHPTATATATSNPMNMGLK